MDDGACSSFSFFAAGVRNSIGVDLFIVFPVQRYEGGRGIGERKLKTEGRG